MWGEEKYTAKNPVLNQLLKSTYGPALVQSRTICTLLELN
uniref:Uncharacterized protein n=1 Tax=Anguilla anguilla TaxID=7936 RepID=A0A0E9SPG1_ANGAN